MIVIASISPNLPYCSVSQSPHCLSLVEVLQYCLSALLSASLGTRYLKLQAQSQTSDGIDKLANAIEELKLMKRDFLYLDFLSNSVYMGTDNEGLSIDPFCEASKKWYIFKYISFSSAETAHELHC